MSISNIFIIARFLPSSKSQQEMEIAGKRKQQRHFSAYEDERNCVGQASYTEAKTAS